MSAGWRRWTIAGLLFAATAVNYVDRQTLSVLSPLLRQELHMSDRDYANVVTAFLVPYTLMYALGGRLIDRIGVRFGAALALCWWSAATMLTAAARSAFSLGAFRFLLGIGEPAIYPAGVRACSEWFPRQERALATGLFSSGSAVGALMAPPLVALLTLHLGWRWAFLAPGLMGLLWLPLWFRAYRKPPAVAAEQTPPSAPWRQLLRQRRVWALVLPRLASDPAWYFYVFWLPDYLQRGRHLNLAEMAAFGWIPFLFADLGNVGGGAVSDWLIRRGVAPAGARKALLVATGCLAPLSALAGVVDSVVAAVGLICLATLLCQCWSTNIAALATDLLPASSTGTVVGMMGTVGSLGGILFTQLLGVVVGHLGYAPAFLMAACLHPVAAVVLVVALRREREGETDVRAGGV
jgi:ACS family hexuronate transporter-like MFS transporter